MTTPRASPREVLGRYAAVALPLPVATPYTYLVPDALAAAVVPGARVVVPVRGSRAIGVVVAVDVPAPAQAAKAIVAVPDEPPALSPALLELGSWMARYYGAPLGLALRAMLPGALWSVGRPAGPAEASDRIVTLTQTLPSLLEREKAFARAPKRRVA
ncbi:MAG TPA: hypothetical protein VNG95_05710, partial [Gemmatimonadales bacterium]|nr:hypothetical protein [Gemmatimonadales bacterium]